MFSFRKSRRIANILIEDYVVRMVENNGDDLLSLHTIAEKPIPKQVIKNGRLIDELTFFELMQEAVEEWEIKGKRVRFFVPQSLIILREVEVPEDITEKNVKQYIEFEVGNSIHFPFKNPIVDVYENISKDRKVTVLAAPEDELMKYTTIFTDLSLKPMVADIQPLGIYRYMLYKESTVLMNKVYMIIEYNLTSINVSIIHNHKVEFIRHQPLMSSKDYWDFKKETGQYVFTGNESRYLGEVKDQLNEIERVMNFYRFSIHQGNQEVNELIVVGDTPYLKNIIEAINERFPSISTTNLQVTEKLDGELIENKFIPVLGLALRGGE